MRKVIFKCYSQPDLLPQKQGLRKFTLGTKKKLLTKVLKNAVDFSRFIVKSLRAPRYVFFHAIDKSVHQSKKYEPV